MFLRVERFEGFSCDSSIVSTSGVPSKKGLDMAMRRPEMFIYIYIYNCSIYTYI